MKTILVSGLACWILLSVGALGAEQPLHGVVGVQVTVKEAPSKRFVTDSRGSFALQGLSPGSYTLVFKAQGKGSQSVAAGAVTVAQTYSIRINGTKRPVNQKAGSDQLLAGLALPVQVAAGAKIGGMVAAAETQKMVWIGTELGSHIPGHWVPADSPEAKGHSARATHWMTGKDVQNMIDNHDSMHQENFGNVNAGGSGR